MKILQKSVATLSLLAISLAAPVAIFAATTKVTPTESPVPTIEATVAPTPVATPAPQSVTEWIMTHKKIDLGVVVVIVIIGYVISRLGKKNDQTAPQ